MMEELEKLGKSFENAQIFNHHLSEHLKKVLFLNGKSPKEWKKYFFVKVPDEITLGSLINLSSEIFIKYQTAAALRDKETIQLTILEQSRVDKYNEAYHGARSSHEEKFKKGLAAKSCEVEADIAVKDLEDAISNQKIAKDFWKSTCDTLTELRKLLEIMGYALSNDAKIHREMNIIQKTR